jgi:uncharacterized Fe-S cluster protein YjdI
MTCTGHEEEVGSYWQITINRRNKFWRDFAASYASRTKSSTRFRKLVYSRVSCRYQTEACGIAARCVRGRRDVGARRRLYQVVPVSVQCRQLWGVARTCGGGQGRGARTRTGGVLGKPDSQFPATAQPPRLIEMVYIWMVAPVDATIPPQLLLFAR